MKVFIGMETSGVTRRAFQARGHDVISCDLLPSQDGEVSRHIQGDIFEVHAHLHWKGWLADLAVFHPTCTYLTISAAWAFNDPNYERYPGVGYHQRVSPETLVGKARRDARDAAVNDVMRLWALPIPRKAIENPIGALSAMWRKPTQVIQPYQFGDDASKATCLWLDGLMPLTPTCRKQGRLVEWPKGSGKMVERWSNQTDSGQNNATPHDDRWQNRSDTFTGIAEAFANQWG